ncbi:MAG: acetyltransferase [Lachnospiraceae bacterium]|nr:acetyltransferase [Lachnospiraceae bacterium]
MKEIVILGAGDFGKEVVWLIEEINKKNPTYIILGYLDDDENKIGKVFNGYECLGPINYLTELNKNHNACAVIANQNGDLRKKFVEMFPGFNDWETLIHPSVNISDTSKVGKGCVICAGNNISVNTVIGDQCLFNISVTMGHDCVVGDYVSIMSGSCICGHVTIKNGAYLATNSTVVPGMKVGDHAKVGAGSVVIRNVKDNITVMGVPAKIFKF